MRAVYEHARVRVDVSGAMGWEVELAQEDADAEDSFGTAHCLVELRGAGCFGDG